EQIDGRPRRHPSSHVEDPRCEVGHERPIIPRSPVHEFTSSPVRQFARFPQSDSVAIVFPRGEVLMTKVLAGIFALGVLVSAAPGQAPVELKEGDKAPAFSLPGSDGKTHKLSDYKGK